MANTSASAGLGAGVSNSRPTSHRQIGIVIGLVGVGVVMVTLIANVVAAGELRSDPTRAAAILAWSFALTTAAFGLLKLSIAVVLRGILAQLGVRVAAVKEALPHLKPGGGTGQVAFQGEAVTPFGPVTLGRSVPSPLPIHRMARILWAPMLVMGAMAIGVGLVLGFIQAGNVAADPELARQQGAWVQGLQFMGEGLLLSGIAFLLGAILGGLREGGGEVQQSAGVTVKTLKMPLTAKLFVGLMAMGMMLSIAQFVLYIVAATQDAAGFAVWAAWLGPTREAALGLILAGIVLALVTIGNVLRFQFHRLREIVTTGS